MGVDLPGFSQNAAPVLLAPVVAKNALVCLDKHVVLPDSIRLPGKTHQKRAQRNAGQDCLAIKITIKNRF